MNRVIKWLRWISVTPGGIIVGIISTFLLHLILYFSLTNFVHPYPEFPERVLTPFIFSSTFIWAGCEIAPHHKLKTGIILFALLIFFSGGLIISTLTQGKWFGHSMYLQGNGVAPVMGIIGAFLGLYLVRKKIKDGAYGDVDLHAD
ncbi:MAG TPA: hypothetical protein VIL78_21515 [Hanamia sp.]